MPFLIRFCIFMGLALVLGFGSASVMVGGGFFATTSHYGPWSLWAKEGSNEADPYTEAHVARLGFLPVTSANTLSFVAKSDSSGSKLYGSCTYDIRGAAFAATWWNLAVFDNEGRTIPHKTGRSSFSSNTIFTAPDGRFLVRLSPDVQPGNWLPAPKRTEITLKLNILRPLNRTWLLEQASQVLPQITLVECS